MSAGPEKAPAERVVKGHLASDPPAVLGGREDPHCVPEGLRGEENISDPTIIDVRSWEDCVAKLPLRRLANRDSVGGEGISGSGA
jgi:hypothetical protein